MKKQRGQHGGPRSGAGQPPGTVQQRTLEKRLAAQIWRERVEAELDPLITAQLELAKGAIQMFAKLDGSLWALVTDPQQMVTLLNAGTEYYRLESKEPDGRMLSDLMNRLMGKPTESLEVSGPKGEPIQVHHHYVAQPPA